jgi:hypothetical protein
MKKTIYLLAIIAAIFPACKKSTQAYMTERTATTELNIQTYFIRVEEVDNDGNTTISPIVTVKVKN